MLLCFELAILSNIVLPNILAYLIIKVLDVKLKVVISLLKQSNIIVM